MGLVQQCARPMVVHNEIIEKELEAVEGTQYVTRESILRRAQEIKGIPLRDIDKTGRLATGKGAIGTVIEESWFGYTPNSESEPDFPEAGVELKVTPYLRGKTGSVPRNGWSAISSTIWRSTIRPSKPVPFGINATPCFSCPMSTLQTSPRVIFG